MGNDNFLDISLDCIVQDRRESFSFEIEATSIIFNDFVIRVFTLEELFLTIKVRFLASCANSTVADSSFGVLDSFWAWTVWDKA